MIGRKRFKKPLILLFSCCMIALLGLILTVSAITAQASGRGGGGNGGGGNKGGGNGNDNAAGNGGCGAPEMAADARAGLAALRADHARASGYRYFRGLAAAAGAMMRILLMPVLELAGLGNPHPFRYALVGLEFVTHKFLRKSRFPALHAGRCAAGSGRAAPGVRGGIIPTRPLCVQRAAANSN